MDCFAMLSVEYAQLLDELWVGSYPQQPEDIQHLKAEGVTAVLSVQSNPDLDARAIRWDLFERFYASQSMRVVRIPIIDFEPADLLRNLPVAVAALDRLIADGERVYVHCTAGINRSPTVCIAWMMRHRGMTLEEANNHVMERRRCYPYPEVLEAWAKNPT